MTKSLTLLLLGSLWLALAGNVLADHSTMSCGQCHVAHHAEPSEVPLWIGTTSVEGMPTFTLYNSPTFDALRTDITQPDGASRMCLGCHDGSNQGVRDSANPRVRFGTADLARSHPVSFTYDSALASRVPNGKLYDPAVRASGLGGTIAADLLDSQSKVQCTSCHDMHAGGKGTYRLRYDWDPVTGNSALCLVCHNQ
jgi:cytochrome c peroxidase